MLTEKILKGADAIDAREAFDPVTRSQFLNASEAMSCIRKQSAMAPSLSMASEFSRAIGSSEILPLVITRARNLSFSRR